MMKNKLRWACRRGMLELDLILLPFFDTYYSNLSADQQKHLQVLLCQSDPKLYAWLMGYETPEEKDLKEIVQLIRESHP